MNLTIEKLNELWRNKDSILDDERNKKFVKRYDEITKAVTELMAYNLNTLTNLNGIITIDSFGPSKDDVPQVGTSNVINKCAELLEDYPKEKELNNEYVRELLHAGSSRDKDFRITSNVFFSSTHLETKNSTSNSTNPEARLASYNYFYVFVALLQKLKKSYKYIDLAKDKYIKHFVVEHEGDPLTQFDRFKKRFTLKYLWMVANQSEQLSCVSLQSFLVLQESDLIKDNNLSYDSEFEKFCESWKKKSEDIGKKLIIKPGEWNDLNKLLFVVSLSNATDIRNINDLVETGNQAVILWGPPGTGKTYAAKKIAQKLMQNPIPETESAKKSENKDTLASYLFSNAKVLYDHQGGSNNLYKNVYKDDLKTGLYELVQFHPGYTYEEFIGGIQPNVDGEQISYKLVPGIFKRFCDCARKNEEKKFVFIIDEINRADLSAVFGELLYALEYRGENVDLPHFGSFSIPPNVYIIGTMNNVDKSLVTFDLALRRRFSFFKLMPQLDILTEIDDFPNYDNLDIYIQRCKDLNKSIIEELNLSSDYQIGQAYFMKISDFCKMKSSQKEKFDNSKGMKTIDCFGLEKLWVYHIEPLLEEYLGAMSAEEETKDQLRKLKNEFEKSLI